MSIHRLLPLLVVFAFLAACGGDSDEPAPEPTPAPAPIPTPEPEQEPEPVPAPEPVAGATFECVPGDAAKGQTAYVTLCATCHGATGDGSGPAGQALDPMPARHDDGEYMNPLTNEQLFTVISQGGTAAGKSPLMAPWGAALGGDDAVWDVVAFVRTLAKDPAFSCDPVPGQRRESDRP